MRSLISVVHLTTVPETLHFFRGQYRYLMSRGIRITAISSSGAELDQFADAEGCFVRSVEMSRRLTPVKDCYSLLRLCWCLFELKPDIVHAHTPKAGLLGMLAGILLGVPVRIYHIHGFPFQTAPVLLRILLILFERLAAECSHYVYVVGEGILGIAEEAVGIRRGKIRMFGKGSASGVDSARRFNPGRYSVADIQKRKRRLGIPLESSVVGFVGRIVRDKGVGELLAAWERITVDIPDAYLILAGAVEEGAAGLGKMLERVSTEERVKVVGRVRDVENWYAIMDLVVLPTYREGLPYVPLEAGAMERPVVVSDIPGCRDAVENGVTGTLVPVGDVEAVLCATLRYLRDSRLRELHGRAARVKVARDFRPEKIWEDAFEHYMGVSQSHGVLLKGNAV